MNKRTLTVRDANNNDIDALSALGAETFADTFAEQYSEHDLNQFLVAAHAPEAYAELISDPRFSVLIADCDSEPAVAYAVVGRCDLPISDMPANSGQILRIYVRRRWQSAGFGSQLLRAAINRLMESFDRVYLGVYSEHPAAQRFYQRHGFVKVGDYTFMVGDHADAEWIMEWRGPSVSQ